MKGPLFICLAACLIFPISGGCGGGEDAAVKEAPADVQTKRAEEVGAGRSKGAEGSGVQSMESERGSRAGG